MKCFSKIVATCLISLACIIISGQSVMAGNAMPSQTASLIKQMDIQRNENAKAKEYMKLQEQRAKAEKRKISDIEMVKRQALEGMVNGNNQLLQMGDVNLQSQDVMGQGNMACLDQAAYDGMVSGMALLEQIKQQTWMQYTFRTH